MIGQISTRAVVTALERRGRLKTGVNATGWAIPPFIIFKGRHHLSAYWTTNELSLQWLKHFDEHTKRRVTGAYRLLIINGYKSHDSLEFQQYCKDNKIITICMPPHLSHLLQPLDVELMRNQITHITKLEFLLCFKRAFNAAITPSNIQGGFRGAGLVLFDPERVILALNVRIRTPPLPTVEDRLWQSQTLSNTLKLGSQSTLVKARIQRHVDSLLTSIVEAFEKVLKGAAIIAHKLVLAQKEIAELRAANKAATRRKSHKRKRVQEEGTLTVKDSLRRTTLKEFGARSDRKKAKKQVRAGAGEPS
ncbi:hypothetical protein HBI88_199150 [Parastagonospora nodorum]|nr:hypothetical protein HBI97_212130 [Parastagonospora nodorum]KAH5815171.1 hypothetical protein HBI93_203810 [Parastagonospora nodorum]KAH5852753.1 hypothetical protein HBI90_200430 [Parastagonospora nodorum]KAH5872197.1 hypothetical protein HBI92_174070 [Parastagonospora nodorum]KAH5895035.1 hypothetical protein HBI89_195580 [Parastagonospora nodorum]